LTTDDDCRGDRLADAKVTRGPLVQKNLLAEPTPLDLALPQRALTLYSPRDEKTKLVTLDWYAQLMGSAQRIMCMTFAFNLDKVFQDVLVKPGKTLRYAVFDKLGGGALEKGWAQGPAASLLHGTGVIYGIHAHLERNRPARSSTGFVSRVPGTSC
jgi:hypothetical protein